MQVESIEDTKRLLRDWGKWSRERLGTEHLPVHPMFREAVKWDPVVYEGHFDDDMGMMVDAAVAQLKRFDLEGRDVLVAYYRDGLSELKITQVIRAALDIIKQPPEDELYLKKIRRLANRHALRTTLNGAESYVSAVLSVQSARVA